MNRNAAGMSVARVAALALMLVAPAGCITDRSDHVVAPLPPAPTGSVAGTPLPPPNPARAHEPAPNVAIAGRWTLATDTGACGMKFGSTSDAHQGPIAPEGGCPGRFYTSRKWTLEQGTLVIRDHRDKPLAQLAQSSPVRFDGKTTDGLPLSLSR
jgi:Protease inhibitor Inh